MLVVERELAGVRLTDLLVRARPRTHRVDLRQLLASGEISVNGQICVHDRRMRTGDVVQMRREPPRRPPPARAIPTPDVLCETDGAVVVAKPAGLPTVPDRAGHSPGVHGLLRAWRPDDDLRIVHRLDRDTSGCLILAKGPHAARHFDQLLRARRVRKTYVALVAGAPPSDAFAVDAWLGPDRRRPGKVTWSADGRAGFREAHTDVRVRRRFRRHALLELSPTTGRGHQLRVHLQSVSMPIVADDDYGGEPLLLSELKPDYRRRKGVAERPLLQRMFLHAERVLFEDVDGAAVDVAAPLPEDLAVALRHVEKHGGDGTGVAGARRPSCD